MKEQIESKLAEIECEEGVRILLAVESGSRAWGFASPDSDWDVRFVYVHQLNGYLTIAPRRDVIERMDGDLDVSGWDLPKALRLFQKSNPAIMEWLDSPIIYRADPEFLEELKRLRTSFVSTTAGLHHYLSMASANYHTYFTGDVVLLKKYLYVLRPMLAGLHIARHDEWPPTLFSSLVEHAEVSHDVRSAIGYLLEAKSVTGELGSHPRVPVLDRFIEGSLEILRSARPEKVSLNSTEALDLLFQRFVRERG